MRRSKRLATRTGGFGPVPTSFRFFDQREWDTFNELVRRELKVNLALLTAVIVDRHRNGNLIALRKGHRQVEFSEEVLKHLEA